ncbi:MAG TPA: AbfB domain-containing protein [Kofleriaceae bacterium]|nr:AbfB domain-containing protein [Kofleriaceae bacterium]
MNARRAAAVYNANSEYVRLRSYNYGSSYITSRSGGDVWNDANRSDDSLYRVVPGLADRSCVSFESKRFPGRYLRHSSYLLRTDANTGGPFTADATFCPRTALSGDRTYRSFESLNFPGYYIRHASGRVRIAAFEDSSLYRQDASFQYTQN